VGAKIGNRKRCYSRRREARPVYLPEHLATFRHIPFAPHHTPKGYPQKSYKAETAYVKTRWPWGLSLSWRVANMVIRPGAALFLWART
jgi:hypothetical protein